MSSYFIGNVLPDTDQPGENDPTFDFKRGEASSMSLKGIPIRIEHSDKLQVGTITRDWSTKDGKNGWWVVWIIRRWMGNMRASVFDHPRNRVIHCILVYH